VGGLGALPLGAVALGWFSLTATKAPMTLASSWQSKAHTWTIVVGVVGWLVAADLVAEFITSYPLLVTATALILAMLLFRGAFSRDAARGRAGQVVLLFADSLNTARQKHFRDRKASARNWNTLYLGDHLWGWVRARFYEQNFKRLIFLLPLVIFFFLCLFWGLPSYVVEVGWTDALHRPGEWAANIWALSMGIDSKMGPPSPAYEFLVIIPLFHMHWLGKNYRAANLKRLHPVSRVRRAQIAFWSYLAQTSIWCFALVAGVLFIGIAAGLLSGSHPLLPGLPLPVLHCSALVLAVAPLAQALPICPPGWRCWLLSGLAVCVGLALSLAPAIAMRLGAKTEFLIWHSRLEAELWALPLLAVLTQGLFFRWLQSHYRRCDLV